MASLLDILVVYVQHRIYSTILKDRSLLRCEPPTLNLALAALSTTWYGSVSMHLSRGYLLISPEFSLQLCPEAVICCSPRSRSIFSVARYFFARSPRCVHHRLVYECALNSHTNRSPNTGQIAASLSSLSRTIEDYSALSKKELITEKQEKAFERVKNFRTELADYRAQFERLRKEREEAVCTSHESDSGLLRDWGLTDPSR